MSASLLDWRLRRFAVVGVANTIAGLAVIYVCKFFFGTSDVWANVIGYAAGLLISFSLNKHWTFGHRGDTVAALGRFLLVTLVAYMANLAVTLYAIDVLTINSYLAQAAGVLPYAAIGYAGSRLFAFAPRH